MRHLGVLLPLPIGLALIGLAWRGAQWQHWLAQQRWRQRWRAVCIGFWLWLASLLLFFLQIAQAGQERPPQRCAARRDPGARFGHQPPPPSPTLRQRLERGLDWPIVAGAGEPAAVSIRLRRTEGSDAPTCAARAWTRRAFWTQHQHPREPGLRRTLLEQTGLGRTMVWWSPATSMCRSLRIARQAGCARGACPARHAAPSALERLAAQYFAFASSRALGGVLSLARTAQAPGPICHDRGLLPLPQPSRCCLSCPIAVIDFETTGGSPALGDRATEVAIVILEDGRPVERAEPDERRPADPGLHLSS